MLNIHLWNSTCQKRYASGDIKYTRYVILVEWYTTLKFTLKKILPAVGFPDLVASANIAFSLTNVIICLVQM